MTLKTTPHLLAAACATLCCASVADAALGYSVPMTITATTPADKQTQSAPPAKQPATPPAQTQSAKPAPAPQPAQATAAKQSPVQPAAAASRTAATPTTPAESPAAMAGSEGPLDLPESPIELNPGGQRILALSDVPARVALADPDVAEITVLKPVGKNGKGAALLLVAKQPGNSSLLVWLRGQERPTAYSLIVNAPPLVPLSTTRGIGVQSKGNAVRLEGRVNNVGDYQQLRDNLARATIGGKPVEVTDKTVLDMPGTVQVDVKVVEFSRNDIQRLGINFTKTNGDITFGFGSRTMPTTGNAISQALNITYDRTDPSALMAQLTALQSEGVARVLAEPTLVAQSGQSASFLAGGEIPIPVPSGGGTAGTFTIQFKEFGVRLGFTPTILSSRTIALKVSPEVSDLDRNNAVTINGFNIPAILTRRAETTVELGEGESFVIGGLISSNVNSVVQKFPVLADLPILGGFFRSVAYEKQDRELLIIATPRFVKPRAKGAPPLPLPGNQASANRPGWGQMFLPSADGSLPGFSR